MLPPAEIERLARDRDVRQVSLDAVMTASDRQDNQDDPSDLATVYPFAVNAVAAWDEGVTGEGVTVAVIDSGIKRRDDFRARLAARLNFSSLDDGPNDGNGHGTHVAGVIAGEADDYVGIAPGAHVLSLKVADDQGAALASDVIEALQWMVDHRDDYGIGVVNISLTSSIADSYRQDPLDAAVEQAWFHGIVVVVAAGNYGGQESAVDHAPANDPYVITVGAFDDAGTADTADDRATDWSNRGLTMDRYAKPELMAPGQNIVSTLSSPGSYLAQALPMAVVDKRYLRSHDVAGRFGGEEFVILLRDTDAENALGVAERVRAAVEATAILVSDAPEPVRVTMSLGVAAFPDPCPDPERLLYHADMAVYRSKLSGRNRVTLASPGTRDATWRRGDRAGPPPGQPTAIAGDTGPDNGNGSPVSPSLPLDARERAQRRPPGCDG